MHRPTFLRDEHILSQEPFLSFYKEDKTATQREVFAAREDVLEAAAAWIQRLGLSIPRNQQRDECLSVGSVAFVNYYWHRSKGAVSDANQSIQEVERSFQAISAKADRFGMNLGVTPLPYMSSSKGRDRPYLGSTNSGIRNTSKSKRGREGFEGGRNDICDYSPRSCSHSVEQYRRPPFDTHNRHDSHRRYASNPQRPPEVKSSSLDQCKAPQLRQDWHPSGAPKSSTHLEQDYSGPRKWQDRHHHSNTGGFGGLDASARFQAWPSAPEKARDPRQPIVHGSRNYPSSSRLHGKNYVSIKETGSTIFYPDDRAGPKHNMALNEVEYSHVLAGEQGEQNFGLFVTSDIAHERATLSALPTSQSDGLTSISVNNTMGLLTSYSPAMPEQFSQTETINASRKPLALAQTTPANQNFLLEQGTTHRQDASEPSTTQQTVSNEQVTMLTTVEGGPKESNEITLPPPDPVLKGVVPFKCGSSTQDMDTIEAPSRESNEAKELASGQGGIMQGDDYGPRWKPPLPRQPPIWCQSRQELCETFDWFKSYQGGVYFSNNAVKGYLLSAFSADRDQFLHGGRLIISHGGGKAESPHSCHGQWVVTQANDQSAHDKSVRALLTNFRESRPLSLVIDDKYILFPYDLGATDVTYAVLGLYTITDAWAEYQSAGNERGRVIRYKFAFRWCGGQGEPWWLNPNGSESGRSAPQRLTQRSLPPSSFSASRPVKKIQRTPLVQNSRPQTRTNPQELYSHCDLCKIQAPQVYSAGWACLNSLCSKFWVLADGSNLPNELDYHKSFLRLPEPYLLPESLRDIAPSKPTSSPDDINTTYAFTRGSHCRSCGRLSCRIKLEHWECVNCKESFGNPGRLRRGLDFMTQELPVPFLDHYISPDSGIIEIQAQSFTSNEGIGRVQSFQLPNGRGFIQHIQAVYLPGSHNSADDIFNAYQDQAYSGELPFRRWPMRAHKCRGDLLTNYFSQNSGEPYHYVGGTANTLPFDKTGSAVVMARDYIQAQILQSLGFDTQFNEILSCAYMERQKMAFHSDSERGLGPVVAGLSLGAPALMHFRAHHKQKRGGTTENAFHQSQIIMSFVLRHGDVLVMNGAPVQDCYEHTVVPTNFRIAATARWIDPKAAGAR